MSRLEVSLLGPLSVEWEGKPLRGFESRKARALLAYLLLRPERRPVDRTVLATLFWPDHDEDGARRNLRQVVHNLQNTLKDVTSKQRRPVILASRHQVGFDFTCEYWLDVDEFLAETERGIQDGVVIDSRALHRAVTLYRGDLLQAMDVHAGPDFEHWLLFTQERLRETVLEILQALVTHHLNRGELTQGIAAARRQLDLDPLSEFAHRSAMRLFALAGRRSQALAQYETCLNVLRLELGVSPLAETTTLYRSILKDAMVAEGVAEPPVVAGPSLSLVGRREPLQRLRDAWARDPEGGGGMLVVTGEPGVGKTRLAKVFLHDAGVRAPLVVGLARSHQRALPRWLGPFRDALRSLAGTDAALREATLSRLTPAGRRAVARLTPAAESSDMTGETLGGEAAGATAGKGAGSSEALRDYFEAMAAAVRSRGDAHLVLLLDDLHWADPASVGLVRDLAGRAARSGLRLIATARAEPGGGREAVDALLGGGRAVHGIEIVELGRLDAEQVGQAAKGLVPDRWAGEVASFLQARCSGLPLLMAEWVNLLGDEGVLVAREDGLAELRRELSVVDPMGVPALEVLVRRRLELLPDSARRVLAMASVIGQTFDVGLLQAAGNELVEVVEAGLSLLLGRWFVRHLPDCWFESRRERDIVRWSRGVRRGAFEFAHRRVWRIVYDTISPHRRRHLHGAVAQSLARWGAASYHDLRAEDLALHLLASGDEGSAVGPLAIAARQASAFGAPETAAVYLAEAERIRSGIPAESVLV